jgi:single-strand DNA-binding protein
MARKRSGEMINRIILVGRLTKDVDLNVVGQSGTAVAKFTLAVERNYKNKDGGRDTDFINIVAFRKLAELCADYLSKGKLAGVEGSLRVRSYEDKKGAKQWISEVVADNVSFLSPRDAQGNQGVQGGGANNAGGDFTEVDIPEEEIPF